MSTGSQGEPMSALTRMAHSSHRKVEVLPGDTVVIAATPIPGNEKFVARTVDQLFRSGRTSSTARRPSMVCTYPATGRRKT